MNQLERIKHKDLVQECVFTASRSSGAGGQNVNKVNSKVTLRFDVPNSFLLNESEKNHLLKKLVSRLTGEGVLIITAEIHRSQIQNKTEAVSKFNLIIEKSFAIRKTRKATRPSKASVRKRLDEKRKQSDKKKQRQKN